RAYRSSCTSLKGAFVPAPDEVRNGISRGGVIFVRATPALRLPGGWAAAAVLTSPNAKPATSNRLKLGIATGGSLRNAFALGGHRSERDRCGSLDRLLGSHAHPYGPLAVLAGGGQGAVRARGAHHEAHLVFELEELARGLADGHLRYVLTV